MERAVSTERALKNAFASAKMEGFRITPEIERDCKRVLDGETSIDECVRRMLKKTTAEKVL